MNPLFGSLISAVPNILSGIISKRARDKQSNLLGSMSLDMPTGVIDAEQILRDNATKGLPGYDKYKGDIMGSMSQGLSAYKDVVDNPAAILGALSTSQTNMNDALSELAIKDAMVKLENEKTLASFLGGTKANTQMQIDQYGDQMKIAAGEEKQRGMADLLQGITNGVASGISTYGGMSQLNFTKDMLSNMSNYWKKPASSASAIPPDMLYWKKPASSASAIPPDMLNELLSSLNATGYGR